MNEPSALIKQQHVDQFIKYLAVVSQQDAGHIMTGAEWKALYEQNKALLLSITPQEIFAAFSSQLAAGQSTEDILTYLGKVINVLHQGLNQYAWQRPQPGTFLAVLMAENDAMLALLGELKPLVRPARWQASRQELIDILRRLSDFDSHYLKKENILFPSMEKAAARFDGLTIMWTLHNQVRGQLRQLLQYLTEGGDDDKPFITMTGDLIFMLHGLVIKESLILFPSAAELFDDREFAGMLEQSFDYGFALIDPPVNSATKKFLQDAGQLMIESSTGRLSVEEALMIFNALPVDITYVDEFNKVRYFNKARDRFFPRSPAVIGRNVNRCHPAESVHVVEEIIDTFRSGLQDSASFWLELKGRMVMIQYFALRSEAGEYRGVLEVSQDITGIRKLEGQRRLLEWDNKN